MTRTEEILDAVIGMVEGEINELHAENDCLRAENKRLREALEPFARIADMIEGSRIADDQGLWLETSLKGNRGIYVRDVRNAREALGERPCDTEGRDD